MKKLLLAFCVLLVYGIACAQTNPTLGVGLETLTMNKGTIDVEVLTKIIMEKQKELKGEALKRFMLKLFPDANYTTKFYIQNCLHILLNEKNPQVIEKEILELTTNYALALGVTYALVKANSEEIWAVNEAYLNYKDTDENKPIDRIFEYVKLIKKVRGERIFGMYYQRNLLRKEFRKYELQDKLRVLISDNETNINQFYSKRRKIAGLERRIKTKESGIFKIKQRREITADDNSYNLVSEVGKDVYYDTQQKDNLQNRRYFVKLKYDLVKNITVQTDNSLKKLNNLNKIPKPGYSRTPDIEKTIIEELVKNNVVLRTPISLSDKSSAELSIYVKQLKLDINKVIDSLSNAQPNLMQGLNKCRNNINFQIESIKPKIKIPFGTLLDVVSLSLSDMEELQKKGFFKNKIDYRTDRFYLELIKNDSAKSYREALDMLKINICKKIEPYIAHYDVIKELISKNAKLKDREEIIKALENQAGELIKTTSKLAFPDATNNNLLDNVNRLTTINNKLIILEKIKTASQNLELYSTSPLDIDTTALKSKIYTASLVIQRIGEYKNDKTDKTELDNKYSDILNFEKFINDTIQLKNKIDGTLKKQITDLKNQALEFNSQQVDLTNEKNNLVKSIVGNKGFYKEFIKSVMDSIINKNFDEKGQKNTNTTISKRAILLSELYSKLDNIVKTEKVSMSDILYLENDVMKALIDLKARDPDKKNDKIYHTLLNYSHIILPLLKIKALQDAGNIGKYDSELMTLFEFIANLDKLDKAQTFTSIVDMLRTGSESVEEQLAPGEFKDGYLIFINAMKKYTLVNTIKNYVEIDVASFLNELQTYYNRNNNSVCSLYLSIGLNENVFIGGDFKYPNSDQKLDNIGFASEKLGLRFRLHSFKKYGGYENAIRNDVYLNKNAPFINDLYAVVYGSGLLYSLANTATDENFDFAHIGIGFGLRFYNALDVNFTLGLPFVKDGHFGDYPFVGIGFDIPLGEYLEKLGK